MRRTSTLMAATFGAATLVALGCSGDGTSPTPESPATLNGVTLLGNGQSATVGEVLAEPIGVAITDQHGAPLPGVTVGFEVVIGNGSVGAPSVVTDAQGVASTTWKLSTTAGTGYAVNVVTATFSEYPGARYSFFATSLVGPAAAMEALDGDGQTGFGGNPLAVHPLVHVVDRYGNPVPGASVNWAVTRGGGTVSPPLGLTDARGNASAIWTLGSVARADSQDLSASVTGLSAKFVVSFHATATPAPAAIVKVSGDSQTGQVGEPLSQPLVVLVQDASGAPMADIVVTWGVACGWYDCEPWTSTTDATGQASTSLTLGTYAGAGSDQAYAIVNGLPNVSVTFTASAIAGPAFRVDRLSGNGQTAPVGTTLPSPLQVRVWDVFWNPKSGVTVNWAAADGSGSTTEASSVTDASGVASTGWTIGTTVGTNNQVATATVPGLAGSPVTFTASATAGP